MYHTHNFRNFRPVHNFEPVPDTLPLPNAQFAKVIYYHGRLPNLILTNTKHTISCILRNRNYLL